MEEVEAGTGGLGLGPTRWEAAHGQLEGEPAGRFRYSNTAYRLV